MKKGDRIKFIKLLSDKPEDWNTSKSNFPEIKKRLGHHAAIDYVQKHFEDNGDISFYLDVVFDCGFKIKGVNSLCFEVADEAC